SMRDSILKMAEDIIGRAVDRSCTDNDKENWDLKELNAILLPTIPLSPVTDEAVASISNKDRLKEFLKDAAIKLYEAKEQEVADDEKFREMERVILLKVIDRKWMDHIDDMDQLRQGIGLQAYGQRDPKVEYKMSAYEMFDEMTEGIQQDTVRLLYHIKVEQKVEREEVAKVTGTNKDDSGPRTPKKRVSEKIYPNDPCPCGSGKKYKQCCGRKA
ncbi:MAG: SEC-C domain-containing protein, partial [Lachnospiraceae bacterium]|nr:SEC-C domain-containing protein [Lachnospiraceae bacterium]